MALTVDKLTSLFEAFNNKKALIIGDVMLDSYIWGKVERISPEAPIPIVTVIRREERLGGAANVGMNIRSLGARPIMCSVIGTDDKGQTLRALMLNAGMEDTGIIESPHRHTTTKFRVFGNNTQMLRVDEETSLPLKNEVFHELCSRIDKILKTEEIDVIIFQDYDKGVITPELIDFVTEMAEEMDIPVTVDPKKRNFMAFRNITLFKPNLTEMREGLNMATLSPHKEELSLVARQLSGILNTKIILNTLAEKGVFIYWDENGESKEALLPAQRRNVADVSGAGDTVISVASLCLTCGLDPENIALLSNLAGGMVCEEAGVVPINKEKFITDAISLLGNQNLS